MLAGDDGTETGLGTHVQVLQKLPSGLRGEAGPQVFWRKAPVTWWRQLV